ncbi:MAG: hypothetical protein R3F65_23865 [bacterium]
MKRTHLDKLIVAALLGAGSLTAHAAEPTLAGHEALLPLRDAVEPRRPIEALPCGLLAVGRPAPRTAPALDAGPLLAIEGPLVDDSRRIRAEATRAHSRLRVLGGLPARLVAVVRPIAPAPAHAALRLDRDALDQSRRARHTAEARAQGPLVIDAARLRQSRLARALAAR